MLKFIFISFLFAWIIGVVIGIVSAHTKHARYKSTHTPAEYTAWVSAQFAENRKKRKAYWNSPMTRADWYIWHLFRK